MSVLRRFHGTQSVSFITCVSYERQPILVEHIDLFWIAIGTVRQRSNFELIAYVIMPDHLHLVLDPREGDFSGIMQRVKMSFGMQYRKRLGRSAGRVWQHRYWDHLIRDQVDMNRHIDYVHYNPAKHSLVESPFEWEHSSIHLYLKQGLYQADWGRKVRLSFDGEFGE